MTRKKVIILGTGSLVCIAVIAALIFLYVTMWSQPTKKNFADAKVIAEKIDEYKGAKRFKEFAAAVSDAAEKSMTYEQIVDASKKEKTALINTLNSRAENAAKIDKSRILKDNEVQKVYATYAEREKIYNKFFKNYADAYPAYISSFASCDKIYHVIDKTEDKKLLAKLHADASTQCLKELKVLSTGSFKPFADYGTEYTRIVNGRQKAIESFAAGTVSSDEASKTIQQLGADTKKNDPNDALLSLQQKSLFNGELTALINVLGKKADQAK